MATTKRMALWAATIPAGLRDDAIKYAERLARRQHGTFHVYARRGVVFVRADYEPRPAGAGILYTTTPWEA